MLCRGGIILFGEGKALISKRDCGLILFRSGMGIFAYNIHELFSRDRIYILAIRKLINNGANENEFGKSRI